MTPLAAGVRRRALIIGGLAATLLVAVYVLAVWTSAGQRFEDAVLKAATLAAGSPDGLRAARTLHTITNASLAGAVIAVLAIGLLRRKLVLGFLGAGVIAASVVTVEILQRSVLRPVLLATGNRREDQSFPSGHTAIAMSVMCALVLVAPYRGRGAAVFLTSLWAASVGVAAVTADWHRPSDTIGSDLVVVIYTCTAVAVLAWSGRVSEVTLPTTAGRAARGLLAGVYGVTTLLAFGVAVVVRGVVGGPALTAGRAVALFGSAAVALTLLGLLGRVDLSAPPPGAGSGATAPTWPRSPLARRTSCGTAGTESPRPPQTTVPSGRRPVQTGPG